MDGSTVYGRRVKARSDSDTSLALAVRIPVIVIAHSGHGDRRFWQADHTSERSDAMVSACRALLASGTSSYWLLIVRAHDHEGLWSVVGGAVCAPSKDLWETRSGRFP